jgi:hypothetical protein
VSAAEKLKELVDEGVRFMVVCQDDERWSDALPQIVAVVEAAEAGVSTATGGYGLRSVALDAALAALDKALS